MSSEFVTVLAELPERLQWCVLPVIERAHPLRGLVRSKQDEEWGFVVLASGKVFSALRDWAEETGSILYTEEDTFIAKMMGMSMAFTRAKTYDCQHVSVSIMSIPDVTPLEDPNP